MVKKAKAENVQVILRVRPLNKKEIERGNENVVTLLLAENALKVKGAGCDDRVWAFDGVYNNSFTQKDVYLQSIHPVVETVLSGYNATVFAYGQSGTGKSFSMCGSLDNKEQYGVIPNALAHIYQYITDNQSDMMEYTVFATFTELYNGKCRDLCVEKSENLELKENAQKLFFVKDLSMWQIKTVEEAMELMETGITRREVKSTDLNADSSRSHSLFSVYVRTWDKEQDLRTEAKLNLVDLAGSERQKQSGASGDTLKEGNNINLSLTALGGVIDCLVKGKPHIPYRSSPLTMLLKDGLGGNSRTIIVGTMSPSDSACNESVSTLRFIDRAKQIKNKPKVQMDPKDAKISELLEEVKKLRRQLGVDEDAEVGDDEADDAPSEGQLKKQKSAVKLFDDEIEALKRRIEELEVQVEMSSETVANAESAEKEHQAKEAKLKADYEAKMTELKGQMSEIEDSQELMKINHDDTSTESKALAELCATFLASIDKEGIWTKTVHLDPKTKPGKKDPQPPTVDDFSRGFKMFVGNGIDMKLHALTRRASMAHIQGSGAFSPTKAGSAGSASPDSTKEPTPPASTKPPVVGSASVSALVNRSFHESGHTPAASPQPDSDSDAEDDDPLGPTGPKKKEKKDKKKDKKDKKKDKKDKKDKKASQAVAAGELSTEVIDSVLAESGITDPSLRMVIDELLLKQRQHSTAMHQQRLQAAHANGEAGGGSPELLATVDELNDALTVAHDTIAKQKSQLVKTKSLAEKKLGDVTQLKEHIESLRTELAEKHSQHAAELALQQDRLVQNHNKKMEQLVNKHTKALVKERKTKEVVQKKLDKQIDKYGKLEQEYDVKVMEADSNQRDLEDLKIDNLKRYKDAAGANRGFHTVVEGLLGEGGKDSTAAMMATLRNEVMDDRDPQKNRLRQVVERSAGGSRSDRKVLMPHSK